MATRLTSLQNLAQEALQLQDASNLAGVASTLARTVVALHDLLPGCASPAIHQHPIVLVIVDKLVNLSTRGNLEPAVAMDAYGVCQELAEGKRAVA